ncbi:MAG: hypothetical protein HOA57_01920 [Candidatus Magasanikbacteria bacterium]|jgi:hypothetical protein|nr:hypothetical protein [Candidatus Magasanikbacteria bacterium]MBT4315236.1 hypothetical protein [Candidatus Magasanikbacteria bacterium]MBT4547118.1 hypothetical protein [Candidatus Magasanikbacteria bacterium]MBT6819112.1 hypothetical protein [Candidatus Magasanikbacteria bacterium]
MSIEQRIGNIEERNRRVESDKAWETSLLRRLSILVLTYLVVVVFMYFSKIEKPFLNAIVPSMAFVLSTLTLPFIKKWWLKKNK